MVQIPLEGAETLAAIVDEGSMDAAARRLRVTPSAVSQRVKALEELVGRVLLVRAKPPRVTDAGGVVVRLARQLSLVQHEAAVDAIGAAIDRGDQPALRAPALEALVPEDGDALCVAVAVASPPPSRSEAKCAFVGKTPPPPRSASKAARRVECGLGHSVNATSFVRTGSSDGVAHVPRRAHAPESDRSTNSRPSSRSVCPTSCAVAMW